MKRYLLATVAFLLAVNLYAQDSAKLNSAITYQTIKGWGGTGGENTQFENCPPYLITQIINESVNDLGLTGLRYESYQGSYSQSYGMHRTWEWTNDNGSPDTLAESALDTGAIDYYMQNLFVPWRDEVRANGDSFNFYMSPSWYFSGSTGDIPAFLRYSPGEYAEYYISNLKHLKNNYGLVPDYVTMCNEAGNNNQFTWQLVATMIQTVMPRIQAAGFSNTWLQFPECVSPQVSWQYIYNSETTPGIWPYVKSLSYHLYGTNDPYRTEIDSFAISKGLVTAQTEQIGQGSDALFADLTIGNVSYWDFYGNGDYVPQNASNTWFTFGAKYWTCRQVMHYNRPGSVRISAVSNDSPKVRVLAFEKGGLITTTLFNDNGASVTTTVTVTGLPPGTYAASQCFGSGTPYSELGLFTVTGSGMLAMPIPNQAIITIYPHSSNLPPFPTNWTATPTYIELPTSTVNLTSSAVDPELSTVHYHWVIDSFPVGATVAFSNPNIASPSVTGMTVAGNYVFAISMTDGSTDTVTKLVTVPVFPGNQAPIIQALQSRIPVIITLPVDTSVIHGSAFDIEGDALTYLYSIVSQPLGASAILTTPTATNTDVTNMTIAGDYTIRYSVSDATHTVYRDILLSVYPLNNAPVISSVSATPAIFSEPLDSTQLSAVTSDPDGDVITHWWTVVSTPAGATPTFSLQGERITEAGKLSIPGRYVFQLTLVDRTLYATKTDTVMVNMAGASVCVGANTSLSDPVTGGAWTSSNTGVATVVGGTGLITGVAAGTATITYNVAGIRVTGSVTVNPLPSAISGTATACVGATTTLRDVGGGTWSSANTGVATAGLTTGVITGVSAGTASIVYTLPTGCAAMETVTVSALSAITGASTLCTGTMSSLTDATGGGAWTSSNTLVATIGSGSGIVSALSPGTTTITYALVSGCMATSILTVTYTPSVITGPSFVCMGTAIMLTDAISGGSWSSSSTGIATVGSGTGVVTGLVTGVSTISYSMGAGCTTTTTVSVDTSPAVITGTGSVCIGATTALSDAGGGTWSSSNTSIATVGLGTGVVSGVTAGTATVTYTLSTGCATTRTITVSALSGITGPTGVCAFATITLSDAVSGGTWISSNRAVATIGSGSGIVAGLSFGTSTISYFTGAGCATGITVTVVPSPTPITGSSSLCAGATTGLSDGVGGGAWTSGTTGVATIGISTGVVTGIGLGTSVITYSLGTGCAVTRTETVSPISAITGTMNVCTGATTTLIDAGGGTWTSSNTSVATVGVGTGIVSGMLAGTATITYTLGTACSVTASITVNPLPSAITGTATVCSGSTTTLSDITGGGVWASIDGIVATIGSLTGVVSGISGGTSVISYTLSTTGCSVAETVTVTSVPAITGSTSVCIGLTTALTDATGGGTWASSNTAVATVGAGTGVVTGVSAGTSALTYTLPGGCAATTVITVTSGPSAITGITEVCAGATTTLSDAVTGGSWSSSTLGVATVDLITGIVSGISAGTAIISYSIGSGCMASTTITVELIPNAGIITGSTSVCKSDTIILNDIVAGGMWRVSNARASISGGVVTGIFAGKDTIAYAVTNTCGTATTTFVVTINSVPGIAVITGADTVCIGNTTLLTDLTGGGTWASSNSFVTTVSGVGVVSGVSIGTDTIYYNVSDVCGTNFADLRVSVVSCTEESVNKATTFTRLKVEPNPNQGSFIVNLLSDIDEQVQVTVTNLLGEKVKEFTTTTNKQVAVKMKQVAGIYLISATTSQGKYEAKVVVE